MNAFYLDLNFLAAHFLLNAHQVSHCTENLKYRTDLEDQIMGAWSATH